MTASMIQAFRAMRMHSTVVAIGKSISAVLLSKTVIFREVYLNITRLKEFSQRLLANTTLKGVVSILV